MPQVARVIEAQRPQLTAQIVRDMQAQIQAYAVTVVKTKTDLVRARTAIGMFEWSSPQIWLHWP